MGADKIWEDKQTPLSAWSPSLCECAKEKIRGGVESAPTAS